MQKQWHIRVMVLIAIILAARLGPAWAGMDWFKNVFSKVTEQNTDSLKQTALSDTTIASGLREALRLGIDKTIALTGKTDGFFANDAIKIDMPQQVQIMDKALRLVGFGSQVDEFVLTMNRAAEKSAPLVKDTFINAVMDMNFNDAQKILKGGDTAATEYFKKKTRQSLQKLFMPVVNQKIAELDVARLYNELLAKYNTVPFARKFPAPSINDYVVNKSLDGIFYVLAQQEQEIRQNPAARVTDLLQQVFK